MNSQVLIDLLRDIKPILNGVRLYSPSERTKEAAHKLIIRISDALTAPTPIPDAGDEVRQLITRTIGFEFRQSELQTVNADDLLRIVSALQASAMVVPDGITIERDVYGTMHIKLGDFDFIQIKYQHPLTDNSSTKRLAEHIAAMLAASPKSGDSQ